MILKESQIATILEWAEATKEIMRKEQRTTLARLICKCLEIKNIEENSKDETNDRLAVSEDKFRQRDVLEKMSEIELKKIGSHLKSIEEFDIKTNKNKSEEYLIDFENNLIVNQEKKFLSGVYDIKIYERKYKSKQISYRFQLSLAPPQVSDLFIVDFQCEIENRMNRILIETISLEDNNSHDSECIPIIFTSSLVLSIYENSFPHFVEFTLVEPCSNAEWNYKVDTRTSISSLVLQERFRKIVYWNVKEGPYRKWNVAELKRIHQLSYERTNKFSISGDNFEDLYENILKEKHLSKGIKRHPLILFYKGDFEKKIASNFEDEDIDGNDKFHEIFRQFLCKVKVIN